MSLRSCQYVQLAQGKAHWTNGRGSDRLCVVWIAHSLFQTLNMNWIQIAALQECCHKQSLMLSQYVAGALGPSLFN